MRLAVALLVLVLVLPITAPSASAWFWDCEGRPNRPECGKQPPPDANRIFAFGRGGHHSLGFDYAGEAVREYESCLFVDLDAKAQRGQVVVGGIFNPDTAVDIRFEDFYAGPGKKPIQRDATIFGQRGDLPLPQLETFLAAAGNATFEVDFQEYQDVVNGPPAAEEDEWNWTSMFFLTQNGIRDNGTKATTRINGQPFDPASPRDVRLEGDDWEAHLVLRNHTSNGQRWQTGFSFVGPPTSTVRDDQYRALHTLPNPVYGGEAQIRIEVTAPTLLQTSLRFELYSPSDQVIGDWTLGGAPTPSDTRTVTVTMDELLDYRFRVSGHLALAQYRIWGTMMGPEDAILYFWWEDITFGHQAVADAHRCNAIVHGDLQQPTPLKVFTPDPKPLSVRLVVLGVATTLLVGLFLVRLVLDSVATGAFLRTFRKS